MHCDLLSESPTNIFFMLFQWVNSDKGGIVVGDELWGVEVSTQ